MQKLKAVLTPFKRSKYNVEQESSCLRVKCIHCNVEKTDAQTQTSDTVKECSRSVTNQFVQVNFTPSRIPRLIASQGTNDSIRSHSLNSQYDIEQRIEGEKVSPIFSRGSPTIVDHLDRNSPKKAGIFLANEKFKIYYGGESDALVSDPEDSFKTENEELQLFSKGDLRARKTRQKCKKTDNSKDDNDRRNPSISPKLKTHKEKVNDSSPPSGIPVPVKSCERSKTYIFENRDLSKSPEKICGEDISLRPNYKNDNSIYVRRDKIQPEDYSDLISMPKKTETYFEAEDYTARDILEADSGAGMACGDARLT